ncbi:MAG TPA: MBL fold metallo-hydrolase [Clostridia bacterium]|nr:MBL fold metallo-hydrolase [Clostridia bacterium]
MGVSLTVLASGSGGNSTAISSSGTTLLVDIGLSCKETCRRLAERAHDPGAIDAILITHEHSDHVQGVYVMAKKFGIPVFMTGATHQAWSRWARDSAGNKVSIERIEIFESGRKFQVGDIEVTPFTIPHDAVDPVGFTFHVEGVKLGVVTDLGYMPASVKEHIRKCHGLVIESNHDLEMLRGGPYPWAVKQRVMSRVGHLSNEALAEFLASDYDGDAAFLILAHLSEANNHPEIARVAAERALGSRCSLLHNRLVLASQNQPLETFTL